jgi:glycosyltransferase involved in cell wall biosynthesis
MKLAVLVGIPCFNEELTVGEITRSILSVSSSEFKFRVIVIDDGSTDNTIRNALVAGAEVITHKSNRGLGSAFESFREFALKQNEDFFVVIDGDGQFSALQILSLLPALVEGKADVVTGSRFMRGKPQTQPIQNYVGNLFASKVVSLVARSRFTDVSCGFRAYSKTSLSLLRNLGPFNFSQHTLLQAIKLGLITSLRVQPEWQQVFLVKAFSSLVVCFARFVNYIHFVSILIFLWGCFCHQLVSGLCLS